MSSGTLSIIATPIGNLDDITARALHTLKTVDCILCEDTRVTRKLLEHFSISTPVESYHHHSDAKKIKNIIELLENGKNLALVTDAGTPGISDPGNKLVRAILDCHPERASQRRGIPLVYDNTNSGRSFIPAWAGTQDDKIKISPIPGACAAIAGLSISGFPTDKFIFLGFPPHKNKRQKFFKEVAAAAYTVVFYESGHRIKKCLTELQQVLKATQQIVVGRELTKKFETVYRGTIEHIIEQMTDERGEFVIIIAKS